MRALTLDSNISYLNDATKATVCTRVVSSTTVNIYKCQNQSRITKTPSPECLLIYE